MNNPTCVPPLLFSGRQQDVFCHTYTRAIRAFPVLCCCFYWYRIIVGRSWYRILKSSRGSVYTMHNSSIAFPFLHLVIRIRKFGLPECDC